MYLGVVDITNHLQVLFNTIYKIYIFLNSIEFVAFGFKFSLFGIMFAFVFLVVLIKALRFGFDVGISSDLKSSREENKIEKKAEGRDVLRRKK